MRFPVANETIARIVASPVKNVETYWPLIEGCLDDLGIYSDKVAVAALATIGVECPGFKPIHEYGNDRYYSEHYDYRKDLGNDHSGDGAKYHGRGFLQVTGKLNYEHYGKLLGIDMIDNPQDPNDDKDPDKALEPHVASAIFAAFFFERKVYEAANRGDWMRVRNLVNGGTNGLNLFQGYVAALLRACEQSKGGA